MLLLIFEMGLSSCCLIDVMRSLFDDVLVKEAFALVVVELLLLLFNVVATIGDVTCWWLFGCIKRAVALAAATEVAPDIMGTTSTSGE